MADIVYDKGVGCSWAISGSIVEFPTYLIQSRDTEPEVDEMPIRNQQGTTVGWVGYDPKTQVTFDCIITGSNASTTASISRPAPGTFITMRVYQDTFANSDYALDNAKVIVKKAGVKESNTDLAKISIQGTLYPSIQS